MAKQSSARVTETKAVVFSMDEVAARVIMLRHQLDQAKQAYDDVAPALLARMMDAGVDSVVVAGMGAVSTVAASVSEPLDGPKAEALLLANGLPVPRKRVLRAESLRVKVNI